ncbi:hypothetical protein FBZ93_1242 [Bradyrhizobium macuxiense]|uniref:Uncharacterized protein n=1 Tax=Bradyrhizobium macuxiense TaxID=1755647 RepID=A0A560KUL2_9BRAD|nr:hypothetical protein [Bradyrhizobium macuxiense]TWB86956.1 hypothetical protein FBZ93_1242 [Bradyrhizobium macuxiense]
MKRILLVTSMVLVAAFATYKFFYPTYTYRYRLTVNIEADGKLHSGSSVVEVTWYAHLLPALVSFSSELRGQAALVDLEGHGVMVATLTAEHWGAHDGNAGWSALWLVPRGFGVDDSIEGLSKLVNLRGKRELALDNLPRILWFSNPRDPTTARTILVDDIPSVLGPSARFAGASVEMTTDPLVTDIRQKLPWIDSYSGANTLYLPNHLGISDYMFVGAAS